MADLLFDGMTKVSFVTSIANISAPTVAELDAGTSLESLITPDGLAITPATASVDNSSLASTFTTAKVGRRSWTIALTCKVTDAAGGGDAKTTLVYQAAGFLAVRRNLASTAAWAASQTVEVYPVEVGEPAYATPAPNEVQKFTSDLMVTDDADTNATVAA